MPGTNIPGVITAGTSYQDGKRIFCDVHRPKNTVVIELKDERYNELTNRRGRRPGSRGGTREGSIGAL